MRRSFITDPLNMDWQNLIVRQRGKYSTMVGAFDIETSNVLRTEDGIIDTSKSFALPYSFQLGFTSKDGGKIFYLFREVSDFTTFMKNMSENVDKIVCIFIHNAQFEFEHIKHYLKDIAPAETFEQRDFFFNNSKQKVLYFRVGNLEFRDSYQLEGVSLAKVGSNLEEKGVLNVKKGEMDYDLIRTPETPLTDDEIEYMIQDVNILCELWKDLLKTYETPKDVPLTNTGKVRRQIKEHMKNCKSELQSIKAIAPSFQAMETNREAFYGGYTHANRYNYFRTHEDVVCFDIASAHPTAMLIEKFPVGKVVEIPFESLENLRELYKTHCFWLRCRFKNISTTSSHPAIYKSGSIKTTGGEYVNGKLIYADEVEISLLDRDLFCVLENYDFDSWEVEAGRVFASKKDYLPDVLRFFIYAQYFKKTAYKNVKGREVEYMLAKININSIFGVCAMDPIRDAFEVDFSTMEIERIAPFTGSKYEGLPISTAYELSNQDKRLENCYISELWGAYITMYSRLRVFELIEKVGGRFLYCDTDSVYYSQDGMSEADKEALINEVSAINDNITNKFYKAFDGRAIPEDFPSDKLEAPKDPSGKSRPIGIWSFDGHYKKFATRGAKSYLVQTDDGKYKLTHSGLPKAAVSEFAKESDPFKKFLNPTGFTIPASTGYHRSKIYQHEPLTGTVTDYLGNVYSYSVPSSIIIYDSEYSTNKIANIFTGRDLTFHSERGIIKP